MGFLQSDVRGSTFTLYTFVLIGLSTLLGAIEGQKMTLSVDVSESLHITDPSYLSITISGGQLRRGLVGYDFSSKKLQNLAAALSPAGVRIGGTYSDFLNFDPTSDDANCVEVSDSGSSDDSDDDSGMSKRETAASGSLDFTLS
ncbi:hypothetical protein EGW08_023647, partial [Elysia chlorotica]